MGEFLLPSDGFQSGHGVGRQNVRPGFSHRRQRLPLQGNEGIDVTGGLANVRITVPIFLDDDDLELGQQFFIKDFEIIHGGDGTVPCHEYDGGSGFLSPHIHMNVVAVDRDQFSVAL